MQARTPAFRPLHCRAPRRLAVSPNERKHGVNLTKEDTMPHTAVAYPLENLVGWERSMVAFLVEKERRSGSRRTVEGYSRMLQDFFGRLGKTPDEVTAQEVFVWAHGKGLSGKDPAPVTIGARMACVSSFFRFLQRMEIVDRNPCDRLERPRTTPSPPRGLSALEVQKLLAAVPATRIGLRNRAILLTLLLTGRRRAEVFRLTRGDLSFDGDVCFYSYRGKGGKTGRRELPEPAVEALRAALWARDLDLEVMKRPRVFMGRHERYVLRAAPTALPGRRASPGRHPHPPAHRRKAPP